MQRKKPIMIMINKRLYEVAVYNNYNKSQNKELFREIAFIYAIIPS